MKSYIPKLRSLLLGASIIAFSTSCTQDEVTETHEDYAFESISSNERQSCDIGGEGQYIHIKNWTSSQYPVQVKYKDFETGEYKLTGRIFRGQQRYFTFRSDAYFRIEKYKHNNGKYDKIGYIDVLPQNTPIFDPLCQDGGYGANYKITTGNSYIKGENGEKIEWETP